MGGIIPIDLEVTVFIEKENKYFFNLNLTELLVCKILDFLALSHFLCISNKFLCKVESRNFDVL